MRYEMKRILYVICVITVLFMFAGCHEPPVSALSGWAGTYEWSNRVPGVTSGSTPLWENITISIYEQNGEFYADYAANGYQLAVTGKAYVVGDEEKITVVLKEYGGDSIQQPYEVGSALFSLRKDETYLITSWITDSPRYGYDNQFHQGVYFVKSEKVTSTSSDHAHTENIPSEKNLDQWIGEYTYLYSAFKESPLQEISEQKYVHTLSIYKDQQNDQYYAAYTMESEGYWHGQYKAKAMVKGTSEELYIIFDHAIFNDSKGYIHSSPSSFTSGDVLFVLKKTGTDLITQANPITVSAFPSLNFQPVQTEPIQNIGHQTNLNEWMGEYSYHYKADGTAYEKEDHSLLIYSENNRYYAVYSLSGWMRGYIAHATVEGTSEEIHILYDQFFGMPMTYSYEKSFEKGDILFTLQKTDTGYSTEANEKILKEFPDIDFQIIETYTAAATVD